MKALLCHQTLLNSFNGHEVTSYMMKSSSSNNVVRSLSVSISQLCFSLLDCSHTSSLHLVEKWPLVDSLSHSPSLASPWMADFCPCLYSNPSEDSDWPFYVTCSWLNQSPHTTPGHGTSVQDSVWHIVNNPSVKWGATSLKNQKKRGNNPC